MKLISYKAEMLKGECIHGIHGINGGDTCARLDAELLTVPIDCSTKCLVELLSADRINAFPISSKYSQVITTATPPPHAHKSDETCRRRIQSFRSDIILQLFSHFGILRQYANHVHSSYSPRA